MNGGYILIDLKGAIIDGDYHLTDELFNQVKYAIECDKPVCIGNFTLTTDIGIDIETDVRTSFVQKFNDYFTLVIYEYAIKFTLNNSTKTLGIDVTSL